MRILAVKFGISSTLSKLINKKLKRNKSLTPTPESGGNFTNTKKLLHNIHYDRDNNKTRKNNTTMNRSTTTKEMAGCFGRHLSNRGVKNIDYNSSSSCQGEC